MRDVFNTIDLRRAVSPLAAAITDNTAIVSQIIKMDGYQGCIFAINLGALADADATFAVTMDHGDQANLSDAAAVAAPDLMGTLALAGFDFSADNKLRKVGYRGNKGYCRLTITPTGNMGNAPIDVIAIMVGARYAPSANPPA